MKSDVRDGDLMENHRRGNCVLNSSAQRSEDWPQILALMSGKYRFYPTIFRNREIILKWFNLSG